MAKKRKAACGSWPSPITAKLIASGSISLGQLAVDGETIYWIEGRPMEGGRNALVRWKVGEKPVECLGSEFNVRSRVHEYGGGAFGVFDGTLYFTNFKDQHLYQLTPGSTPRAITHVDGLRHADLVLDRQRQRLICVREDHTAPGEARNYLVAVSLHGKADQVLAEGYNFYSNPRLSPDGTRMAWLCWNHPNMPWDGTELWTAEFDPGGMLKPGIRVAGRVGESIFQPEWSPDGILHFVSDRTGWWNLYCSGPDGIQALCPMQAEFGEPQWAFGMRTYAFLSVREILCTYTQAGMWKLARLDTKARELTSMDLPFSDYGEIHAGPGFALFEAGSPEKPFSIIRLDLSTGRHETLRRSFEPVIDPGYFSSPQAVEFPTENGKTAHGIFYSPASKDCAPPRDELPPLLVLSHGGPTGATSTSLRYSIQYWTSRGLAVLDVNYGGSSGYGRDYRTRLNGKWGIVDVEDCCNGARWLAQQGKVDGNRLAIRGGSAGGYTTLAALTFKNVFQAGASHYGIGDMEIFAQDTHKFESRYLESLIGRYPERKDLYHDRSPVNHLDHMTAPLILFQGDEDKVVPPNQAELMFQAVRSKGIPVAYLLFKGEQHGFRKAENIVRSYEAELYFYSRIFHFKLPESIEPVEIANL